MTLDASTLATALQAIGPQATTADAAQAWALAVRTYANGLSVPGTSTAVTAAAAVLQSSLATAFGSASAAPGMETAFTTFGAAAGVGMAPAYTATPPGGEVGFATLFATVRASASVAAEAVAGAINTWMKTGTAVPSGGGPAVHWG
jgi:hypothetical protein